MFHQWRKWLIRQTISYSKLSGKIYWKRDFGHDVVMLYIKMEGWSPTHSCLWLSEKQFSKLEWYLDKYACTLFGGEMKEVKKFTNQSGLEQNIDYNKFMVQVAM